MPLQRRPPPAPTNETSDRTLTPPLSPSTPASSNPSFSSTSTSDSLLSSPFEHLHIKDNSPVLSDSEKQDALSDETLYETQRYQEQVSQDMIEGMQQQDGDRSSRMSTPGSPSHHTRPLPYHSQSHYHPRAPRSPASTDRPVLPHRNTSYSRRHASFDSPREIPMPCMPSRSHNVPYSSASRTLAQAADHRDQCSSSGSYGLSVSNRAADSASGTLGSPIHSPVEQRPQISPPPQYMDTSEDETPSTSTPSSSSSVPQQQQQRRTTSGPVHLLTRPFSAQEPPRPIYSPTPVHPAQMPDRSSTSSLPLPMHTPVYTLPPVQGTSAITTESGHAAAHASELSSQPSASLSQAGPSAAKSPHLERGASPLLFSNPYSTNTPSPTLQPDWLREMSGRRGTLSPSSTSSEISLPPPAPPTVLTPPLLGENAEVAHEPFLSHAPPPHNSYLAVETSPREYSLVARLPGFRRDSITLSTRRRRVLHVVADSWEPNGGHFERRISFGYDADLAQVRAEFDGELLRVIVPRRVAPMTYWGTRI